MAEIKCILQIELNTYPIYKKILIMIRPRLSGKVSTARLTKGVSVSRHARNIFTELY